MFDKAPVYYKLQELIERATDHQVKINNQWMAARLTGYYSFRWRLFCAWEVFTGRADAVKWPGGQ